MVKTLHEVRKELDVLRPQPFIEQFPFSWYPIMQAEAPVFYDESLRAWSIFLYEDVQRALMDHETFSSYISRNVPYDKVGLINSDPPRHRKLRSLVNQAFTPRRVASLEPRIVELVRQYMQRVLSKGEMDVVDDIGYPLPATIIAEMIGVPEESLPLLREFISDALRTSSRDGEDEAIVPGEFPEEMYQAFAGFVEQRRCVPQDDLMSSLVSVQVDDEYLSEREIFDFCVLLFVAGHVTTMSLITSTFLCFLENPHVLEMVRGNLALVPALTEEVVRYYGPVQAFARRVTHDVELRGQQLKAGEMAMVWFGSANHDARVFVEPHRIDPLRYHNKHVAFGHGIHFCLGAPLARLEAPIAIRMMLERMEDIELVPGAKLEKIFGWQFFGLQHLPIRFRSV